MTQTKRKYIIGLIWGLLFWWWMYCFWYYNWYFKCFSPKAWRYLINEFRYGWRISAVSDWVFVISLILALPAFFIGWNLCLKVRWTTLFKKIKNIILKLLRKKETVVKKRLKVGEKKGKITRPPALMTPKMSQQEKTMQKMPSSAIKKEEIDLSMPAAEEAEEYKAPPKRAPDPPKGGPRFLDDDFDENTPLSDIHLPERDFVQEDISELVLNNNFLIVRDIPNDKVSFVAVADGQIVLTYIDEQSGDWLADEDEFEGEDPLWFSESFHRVSPVFGLLKAKKKLAELLQEKNLTYQIVPCLIEKEGNIINAEDMLDT